jgi:hypothetical protein
MGSKVVFVSPSITVVVVVVVVVVGGLVVVVFTEAI